MRICYFADGNSVHTLRWMRFFIEKGHEMHLISFAEVSEERSEALSAMRVKYHGHTGNVYFKKFWRSFGDLRFVKAVLRAEKIEILHSHYLGTNAWYGAMSGFHPHVITIMGGGDVTGPGWKPDGSVQAKWLTPYALRNADHLTSWSAFMADVVRPYSGDIPIDVVHGGIHLESFCPAEKPAHLLEKLSIPHRASVVFSPRLMRPLSNIDKIAQATCLVAESDRNLHFVVAFPGTVVDSRYADRVKQIFNTCEAGDRVRFVSEISHGEIADYYRLADVTVSIPDTDGTPMTVLESMACGTPTVIGNLPDYDKEYFEDGKTTVMVDVKDPQSIADGILRILTDDELRSEVTSEARRRVELTGSYEYQMSKMEEIYRQLV